MVQKRTGNYVFLEVGCGRSGRKHAKKKTKDQVCRSQATKYNPRGWSRGSVPGILSDDFPQYSPILGFQRHHCSFIDMCPCGWWWLWWCPFWAAAAWAAWAACCAFLSRIQSSRCSPLYFVKYPPPSFSVTVLFTCKLKKSRVERSIAIPWHTNTKAGDNATIT